MTRKDFEAQSSQYLQFTAEQYFYDGNIGLYRHRDNAHPRFFHVDVRRDWPTICLSLLTLLGLGLTVYYTRKQWQEGNRSAVAAEKSLGEIQKQTKLNQDIVRGTSAAYVSLGFGPPINQPSYSPGMVFVNQETFRAEDFSGSVELQCEDLVTRKIVSHSRSFFGGRGVTVAKGAAIPFTPIAPKGCDKKLVFAQATRGLIRKVKFTYLNGMNEHTSGAACDEYVEMKYLPDPITDGDAIYRTNEGWRPCSDIPAILHGAMIPFDTNKKWVSPNYRKQHPEAE